MLKKLLVGLVVIFALLAVVYTLGPVPDFEDVNPAPVSIDLSIDDIEDYIRKRDAKVSDLKPGNEGKLVWYDSTHLKTEYVVLYLHGFSASGEEGSEIHEAYAKAIGANLYIPRLEDNGRKSIDTYKNLTPKIMIESAKEAIAVSKLLGDKIILVSCSTGGTYGAYLGGYDPAIVGQVMLSPNIDLYDTNSNLIVKPWGRELLNIIQGGEYNEITHYTEEQKKYWNSIYHNEGIVALKSLIHETMTEENFQKIKHPVLVMVYYKNQEEQDKVVSVERMRDFYNQISTDSDKKKFIECPICQNHVIGNKTFNTNTDFVLKEVLNFSKEILNIGSSQ